MATAKDRNKKDSVRNNGLKKCFAALVDRKQVNLDEDVLKLMLKKELQINLDALDENLSSVLPIMLVTYMKAWPGWQRSKEYYSGKLNFKDWYDKFRQYIVLRLNFLIKSGYNTIIEEIKQDRRKAIAQSNPNKAVVERGMQTDYLAPKGLSPFAISIDCPPSVLNSILFADAGDDIIIRQHPDIPWSKIDMKQLIHWPYVEIEFFSPELSFRRRTCFEYNRYINFINTPFTYDKSDYIEQVEIINTSNERNLGRNCYTLKMLSCYVKEYVNVLKLVNDMDKAEVSKIEIILNEFLKDIEEIDMNNTMATNTSVVFNIGRCVFHRNKKLSKGTFKTGTGTDVGYCEIIVPKMETALNFFKGVQDVETPDVTFKYLNILKANLATNNSKSILGSAQPIIVYKCNFCNVSFKTDSEILTHFEQLHKMDPNVLCLKCKKAYTICFLTNMRWKHVCSSSSNLCNKVPIIIN
ncbi:hypothetical protein NQ318_008458 [Aromia moschata]|uniref:C2H2-type domain-containing protein n=1 Tax=Aromia moschata TaxID=1265417 RepID=A0AAV8YAW6_9CUCU|nr:hypothetical protein NQ318_008458 [Aromia moschata]